MTPTLWAWCDCDPDPFPVATRTDTTRLDQIRETVERQLAGHDCDIRTTVDQESATPPITGVTLTR